MAFAGIFQPFARLRWIRFGLLMRDRKFSRRFSVPQTTPLAPLSFANRTIITSVACSAFLAIMVPSEDSNIDRERLPTTEGHAPVRLGSGNPQTRNAPRNARPL
jgi:hypothetical protein